MLGLSADMIHVTQKLVFREISLKSPEKDTFDCNSQYKSVDSTPSSGNGCPNPEMVYYYACHIISTRTIDWVIELILDKNIRSHIKQVNFLGPPRRSDDFDCT